jgi:hypothetical protein
MERAKIAEESPSVSGEAADVSVASAEESVKFLLDRWASLNLVRGVLTGLACVVSVWAVVGETKEMVFDLVA